MNRHELIKGFVKKTFGMMVNESFPESLYAKERKDYFLKHRRKSHIGVVPNKEIASEALWHMIRIGKVDSAASLREILSLPFFSKHIKNPAPFLDHFRAKRSRKFRIDVQDLGRREYEEKVRSALTAEIIEQRTAEIDKAIMRKRAEYESLPSVLDGSDFEEPEVLKTEQEEDRYAPWWKRLSLDEDPFPTREGLQEIAEEFYERVVYKTELFRKYDHYVKKSPKELFKNTIFFGEFGSGKTTLFQYLKKILWARNIPAFYVQLFTEGNIHSLRIRFKQELLRSIALLLHGTIDEAFSRASFQDLDEQVILILQDLVSKRSTQGVVVFIDDLHKNVADSQISLEFLNYLQIFTARMNRSVPDLRMSFFVAGALDWRKTVEREPRYSGSFARREVLPDITAEDAFKMLNLRLEVFYPNPELKREVKREFVEQVYADLKHNNLPLTFRSFISRVVIEFQNGHFSILTSDPVHISEGTLESIRGIIEESEILRSRFEKLFDSIGQLQNRRKALIALIHAFLNKGATEGSVRFQEHLFHYKKLSKAQLIQKATRKRGGFKWVVCPDLMKKNGIIMKRFALSLENYLIPLYAVSPMKPVGTNEEIDQIEEIMESIEGEDAKQSLNSIKEFHQQVIEEQMGFEQRLRPAELVALCRETLEELSEWYFRYMDQTPIQLNPLEQWRTYWHSPSETQQFLKSIGKTGNLDERIWAITNMYRQTFSSILGFIMRQIERAEDFPVASLNLEKSESYVLDSVIRAWRKGHYGKVIEKLHELMLQRLRTHVHNLFVLLFGGLENRIHHIPRKLREKARESARSPFKPPVPIVQFNEFGSFTLGEIASVMASESDLIGDENWTCVFSYVFESFDEEDLKSTLLELDGYLSEEELDARFAGDLKVLIVKADEILKCANRAYITLVTNGTLLSETNEEEPEIYLSFSKDLRGGLAPIVAECQLLVRLLNSIGKNLIPLDNPGFIQSSFDCSYREFLAFLGLGIGRKFAGVCDVANELVVLEARGPSLAVKVEKRKSVYDAYVIHSSKDKDFVDRLVDDLRLFGLQIWYDKDEIGIGDSITDRINQGLLEAKACIVVLSPNALGSEWVGKEIGAAMQREINEKNPVVLPILLDDCEIPPLLKDKRYADFRKSYDASLQEIVGKLALDS